MYEYEIKNGFESGRTRVAESFDVEVGADQIDETRRALQIVVDQWPFEVSENFVKYMSEVLAVAAVVRFSNEYPQLTKDQIIGFFGHSADILDSLKHV